MKRQHQPQGADAEDIRAVAALLAGVHDAPTMRRLLAELLTPAESRDLALRWRLLQKLRVGEPQRQIARELGISLCKITRGSRILKQPRGVMRALLDQMEKTPANDAGKESP